MSDRLQVRGDVVRVVTAGFEDHGPAGTVRFDQSVVRVAEPDELAGSTLTIVLDGGPDDDRLRREGPVAFALDPDDLELDVLFGGALSDVREPAGGAR